MSEDEGAVNVPRAMLEAMASTAMIECLDPEQQTYEMWLDDVDYQGPWPQIPWNELSHETLAQWRESLHCVKLSASMVVVLQTHSDSDFLEHISQRRVSSSTRVVSNYRTPSKREWTASSNGDLEMKNRPKCPLCTSLKKSTPCKGGPPCSECKRKGYTASECQNYVPGQGNKGRRRMLLDANDRPNKRARVRPRPEQSKEPDLKRREQMPGLLVGEETPPSCEGNMGKGAEN